MNGCSDCEYHTNLGLCVGMDHLFCAGKLQEHDDAIKKQTIDDFVDEINYYMSLKPEQRKVVEQIARKMKGETL